MRVVGGGSSAGSLRWAVVAEGIAVTSPVGDEAAAVDEDAVVVDDGMGAEAVGIVPGCPAEAASTAASASSRWRILKIVAWADVVVRDIEQGSYCGGGCSPAPA